MPTNKKRITITVTGQLERDLDIIWGTYPNLRDNVIETIAFVLTIKASELLTGATPRTQQAITVADEFSLIDEPESVPATDEDGEEWAD